MTVSVLEKVHAPGLKWPEGFKETMKVVRKKPPAAPRKAAKGRRVKSRGKQPSRKATVEIALIGSKGTVMRRRREEQVSSEQAVGAAVLSERTKLNPPKTKGT